MKPSSRDYDSTVARIAGNILSGAIQTGDLFKIGQGKDATTVNTIAAGAVSVARAIVAECKRTDPEAKS